MAPHLLILMTAGGNRSQYLLMKVGRMSDWKAWMVRYGSGRLFTSRKPTFNLTGYWISIKYVSRILPMSTAPLSATRMVRSEEHTSELQSRENLVCRLL